GGAARGAAAPGRGDAGRRAARKRAGRPCLGGLRTRGGGASAGAPVGPARPGAGPPRPAGRPAREPRPGPRPAPPTAGGGARAREELGLDRGRAVQDLELAILRGDDLLPPTRDQDVWETCPWPGLQSYSSDRADGFFGRTAELRSALAMLHGRGVLVVVGPS